MLRYARFVVCVCACTYCPPQRALPVPQAQRRLRFTCRGLAAAIAAPLICAIARAVTFIGGSKGSLRSVVLANWIDRCFAGSMFPLYLTVCRASVTDLVLGPDLATATARMMGPAGLAVAISPFAGGMVMQVPPAARRAYVQPRAD